MSRDAFALCQQDLRITARFIQLASELDGFSRLCMKHAAVQTMARLTLRLIELASENKPLEVLASLAAGIARARGDSQTFPPLAALLARQNSWIDDLAAAEKSLCQMTVSVAPEQDDTDHVQTLIATSASESSREGTQVYWRQMALSELAHWQTQIQNLVDGLSDFSEEY